MNIATVPPDVSTNGHTDLQAGQVVVVTPEIAGEWLTHNIKNRNLRERVAQMYATDMANGDWRWTGETIKFDANGDVIDGQHRLRAVVIAQVAIPMLVVRGLDSEAQDDIDRGIPRKFSDVLHLRGETNTNTLAAIVRRVHLWEQGQRKNLSGGTVGGTTAQLLRTLERHPELREIATRAQGTSRACDLPGSVAGLAWWLFSRIDDDDADFFFARLADGQGLTKGDPIYELRRTLQGSKTVRGERSQSYLLAITIKGWNAYRNGETVGLYRWKPGGAKPEPFPEPA